MGRDRLSIDARFAPFAIQLLCRHAHARERGGFAGEVLPAFKRYNSEFRWAEG
jgi:hypothetical protein